MHFYFKAFKILLFLLSPSEFFNEWFNIVDLVVIIVSFIVTVVYTSVDLGFGYAK